MSNKVRFYTIAFEDSKGKVFENSIPDFLYNLNDQLNNNIELIKKELPDKKKIRTFSLLEDNKTLNQFVIPFGKLKSNVSYTEDKNSKNLTILDYNIYDVNLMYFDGQHKVMILTQDKIGPGFRTIENYLNLFIDPNENMRIKINPIYINDSIDKIKKAESIDKIFISFDFSKSTQAFINERLKKRDDNSSFLKSVKSIAMGSKDIDANNLKLQLGAGGKNKKLDMESLIAFLDAIHIQDDFIKEIEVHYSNGKTKSTIPAKLKKSNIVLFDCFTGESTITQEILLRKSNKYDDSAAQKIILKNINNFYSKVRDYFS